MTGKGEYPSDWEEIAGQVKERAGWRCEHCGHPHQVEGSHILTVHHLDGDKSNCNPDNLLAACQRCHLSIQARYRPGQLTLPGVDMPDWCQTSTV
jgi:5-methylcytosine-specific restriction endonuclease McrA